MWRSAVGNTTKDITRPQVDTADDDDWETDADFVNEVSEKEQRWGSKTVDGSGRVEHISVNQLRADVKNDDVSFKQKQMEAGPKASYGYGGKFGVQKDRMDKSAVDASYKAKLAAHASQTDAAKGFGGKYGVQRDRVDKSAVDFSYKENLAKHQSQTDAAKGFGGKFGVQKQNVDKSAVGYDYQAERAKHESQKDYSAGFGGKYGVQKDHVDKSAVGYEYKADLSKHESQKDYSKGFGGQYGVETDKVDKSAGSFEDMSGVSSSYQKTTAVGANAGNIRAKFENLAVAGEEESRKRVEEEKARRKAKEERDKKEAERKQREVDTRQKEMEEREQQEREQRDAAAVAERERLEREQNEADERERLEREQKETDERERRELESAEQEAASAQYSVAAPESYYDEAQENQQENYYPEEVIYEEGDNVPEQAEDVYEMCHDEQNEEENIYSGVDDASPLQDLGLQAKALFDYQATGDDEISFDPDDIITNIEQIDEGWWSGTCHGRTGLFPANYVELI